MIRWYHRATLCLRGFLMNRYFVALVITFSAAAPVAAQVLYGSITGVVQDSAGALVPGASARIHNVGTAQEFTTQTNEAGSYTFPNLQPGTYDLAINANGFRALTRRGITITVNTVRREDVALEVG